MPATTLPFVVVAREPHDCPYLPGRTALTPLRLPLRPVPPRAFDELLSEGDRRAGPTLYRTECPECRACEALRVPAERFLPTKSQRRVWRQNEGEVVVEVGPPLADEEHVRLYNRHRSERGLAQDEVDITLEEYEGHYVRSCVPTWEVRYLVQGRLVAVSIVDVGRTSMSSVYHYFDPDESRRSLGVYSVLKELELCKKAGLSWYYLGLWVGDCANLSYKSGYYPHQRRAPGGEWREFAGRDSPGVQVPGEVTE